MEGPESRALGAIQLDPAPIGTETVDSMPDLAVPNDAGDEILVCARCASSSDKTAVEFKRDAGVPWVSLVDVPGVREITSWSPTPGTQALVGRIACHSAGIGASVVGHRT